MPTLTSSPTIALANHTVSAAAPHPSTQTPASPGPALGPDMARDLMLATTAMAGAAALGGAGIASSLGGNGMSPLLAELLAGPAVTAAATLVLLLIACRGLFSVRSPARDALRLAGLTLASSVAGGLGFLALHGASLALLPFAAAALGASAIMAAARMALAALASLAGLERLADRRIAIVGAGREADLVSAEARRIGSGIRLAGIFDDRRDGSRRESMQAPLCGTSDDLEELIRQGAVDEVVIALPRWATARINNIVERLARYPIDVHAPAHLVEAASLKGEDGAISRIGPLVVERLYRRPVAGWAALAKEALDRAAAAMLLVALAPLMGVIAALVRLETPGPAFFRQTRHGLSGRLITVWKFRTMRTLDDGAVVVQASKGDARITRMGALLRKTSLDELPQLINVVRGEMSLVGPRPHAVAHNIHYGEIIDGYNLRHKMKPGITGLAQISGFRGETKDPALMQARIDHDLRYIRGWSLALDLKILLLTPFLGLVHRNAY